MRRADLRRVALVLTATLVVVLVANGLVGFLLFSRAQGDPLERADAIIVLGGEHDGREAFGLKLAQDGLAKTVVLSDPYGPGDPVMKDACRPHGDIEVICRAPIPSTTRGEAYLMRVLAKQRGWKKIIVASWRYHLPRARVVFDQCFSEDPGAVVMQAVPRSYHLSFVHWELIYAYQWGGLAKALWQGDCPPASAVGV
jgi:uncharacterized SAM-binding protein YcdF (DUF218 family)